METERLILRQWKESDRNPFFEMNSDPDVMKYFPSPLSRKESDDFFEKLSLLIEKQGFGLDSGQLLRKLSEIDDFLRKINDLASINQWKTVKSPLKWWKMAENGQKW